MKGFGHPLFVKPHFGHPVMKILAKTLVCIFKKKNIGVGPLRNQNHSRWGRFEKKKIIEGGQGSGV